MMDKANLRGYLKKSVLYFTFLILLGSLLPKILSDSGDKNLYVHQANAFMHGQLELEHSYPDVAIYNGKYYVPFPPFPSLLLIPFVAILGVTSTKVMLISIFLSILSTYLLMQILKKLEINPKVIPWILAAFFLGTAYWSSLIRCSSVWFFAHVVSITFIFLAIYESLNKGRGVLIGLFLGVAFLSRQLSIYSVFFILSLFLYKDPQNKFKPKTVNIIMFFLGLGFCISIYLFFNWLRFDNMLDTGYSYISLPEFLKQRVQSYGLFHPAYLPFNFLYMFVEGFHIEFTSSNAMTGIMMDPFGTSITFASPFVFFALWAKWRSKLLWGAWFSIILTLLTMLLYYNNGYVQANALRFSLDFLPILILLVALSIEHINESLWKGAIIYSIFINIVSLAIVFLGTMGL